MSTNYMELGDACREYLAISRKVRNAGGYEKWASLGSNESDAIASPIARLLQILSATDLDSEMTSEIEVNVTEDIKPVSVLLGKGTVHILPWYEMADIEGEPYLEGLPSCSDSGLTLAVCPQIHSKAIGEAVRGVRNSRRTALILVALEDIDAVAEGKWTLVEMILFKIARIFLEGGVDADAIYSEWLVEKLRSDLKRRKPRELADLKRVASERKAREGIWLHNPQTDTTISALKSSRTVFLEGRSSSGKTILALSAIERLLLPSLRAWYVDVGQITVRSTYQVGLYLLRQALAAKHKTIILLDDMYTQSQFGITLVSLLQLIQDTGMQPDLSIVGVTWPGLLATNPAIRRSSFVLMIDPASMRAALIEHYSANLEGRRKQEISDSSGDDLLILRLRLEASAEGKHLSSHELGKMVWQERAVKNARKSRQELERAAFVSYLINQYECETEKDFIKEYAEVGDKAIHDLVKAKLLVKTGTVLSSPHRSFAKLIFEYLLSTQEIIVWLNDRFPDNGCVALLLKYIESIAPSRIWSVLKLIGDAEISDKSSASADHFNVISTIWQNIDILLARMVEQQQEDPTWGNTISSAHFACQAFTSVGWTDLAERSRDFIRECYTVKDGFLEIDLSSLSTGIDFAEILKRLRKEEIEGAFPEQYSLETSEDIDMPKFHANWIAGLALGAEAYFATSDTPRLDAMVRAIESRAENKGYYYPARVPWVTARVLMALGRCGRTIDNSPTVRNAADWLMSDRKAGGARTGVSWLPGTDGWNTTLETTAMVILALRSVGIPRTNQILLNANRWISNSRESLLIPGGELDASVALAAYLSMGGTWTEIRPVVLHVAEWASAISLWRNATESAKHTQEQSCRAAEAAAFLITEMWRTLRSDLPQFLAAVGVSKGSQAPTQTLVRKPGKHFVSYEWDVAVSYASEDSEYVSKVVEELGRSGVRVFLDTRETLNLWANNLIDELSDVFGNSSRYCVVFLSSNYVMKDYTEFERQIIQATQLTRTDPYLMPISLDGTGLPGAPSTVHILNAEGRPPQEISKMILLKIEIWESSSTFERAS